MIHFLIFLAQFVGESNTVFAQANFCDGKNPGTVVWHSLPSYPSYFFALFPKKRWASYRGENSNWILDLETGKQTPVPGNEDPVPMPDEKTMSTPRSMRFYSIEDYLKGNSTKPIFEDQNLAGVYQSIATLESMQDSHSVVRVLTDNMSSSAISNGPGGSR